MVTGANAPDGGAEGFVGYFTGYPILARARRMKYQDIITAEEGKRGGRPCIRGLRITVGDVLGWLAAGLSNAQILADYPNLPRMISGPVWPTPLTESLAIRQLQQSPTGNRPLSAATVV